MLLIFKQKIIFIPALFLEILQRYYKLIILGTLGKLGHVHQKQWHQTVENFYVYPQNKKITWSFNVFLQILHFTGSYNLRLTKDILGNNSRIKILPYMDFFAVFTSPRWTFIFIFCTLFSSFPLDYPVCYIDIKSLGMKS